MANVNITINNRVYKVSCDNGQEERLTMLSHWADERVGMIAEELGQIGDTRLMLLTLLMVCDELFELKERNNAASGKNGEIDPETEEGAAQIIAAATTRINALTERFPSEGANAEKL